jgi:diguanylate cyclase (GGDEF)-like protein
MRQQQMLAEVDGLTGLLNKTNILQRATAMVVEARTRNRVGSMFMMDIDFFKNFNDTNGHLRGDDLLKSISQLLGEHIRDGESLGRFGGEEFLLLMPGVEKAEALQAADRIRTFVAEQSFPGGEAQPGGRVTISGGVATWPTDGRDAATVLARADEALYQAKRAGRDRITAYGPPELALMEDSGTELRRSDLIPPGEVPKSEPSE